VPMNEDQEHLQINADKWDIRARTYDKKRYDFMRYMQRRTIHIMPISKGIGLLDIGCGTGWALEHAAKLAFNHGNFQGIDISPGMIERAKERSKMNSALEFRIADAKQLPFAEKSFDLTVCTNSFHHYMNPEAVLKEIFRVLKSKGRIYITDFTADGPISRLINNRQKRKEVAHVNFYSTKEYQSLFAGAGLRYISRKRITPLMMKTHVGEKP
jgi:ubiquinone/menaquinone biosynthesis C-methylase UbiE